jgi:hypothetical protein
MGGEDENEEGESSECVSHSMMLQCADTLLDYLGRRGFKYDITAARKIHTAESLKQFTKASDHYNLFLKINISCVKKCAVICDILLMHQTKYYITTCFSK